jgi:hypothetical protein
VLTRAKLHSYMPIIADPPPSISLAKSGCSRMLRGARGLIDDAMLVIVKVTFLQSSKAARAGLADPLS